MSGYVYAIEGSDGLIKIGYTHDPQRRLSKIQSDNQGNLRPLGYVPATLSQETELHALLSASQERGEWFRPSRLVQAVVAMMRPWPSRDFRSSLGEKYPNSALALWISESTHTLASAAKAFGVSTPYLSRIVSGQCRPSPQVAVRIERCTQIDARLLLRIPSGS